MLQQSYLQNYWHLERVTDSKTTSKLVRGLEIPVIHTYQHLVRTCQTAEWTDWMSYTPVRRYRKRIHIQLQSSLWQRFACLSLEAGRFREWGVQRDHCSFPIVTRTRKSKAHSDHPWLLWHMPWSDTGCCWWGVQQPTLGSSGKPCSESIVSTLGSYHSLQFACRRIDLVYLRHL